MFCGGAHASCCLRPYDSGADEHCALVDEPLQLIGDSQVDGDGMRLAPGLRGFLPVCSRAVREECANKQTPRRR